MISSKLKPEKEQTDWQLKLYEIIFEAETPSGKWFDVILLWTIVLSVLVVFLESIADLKLKYGDIFFALE